MDQTNPPYYKSGKIEVTDFIEQYELGWLLGNVTKYISRAGKKDPTTELLDLKKARWYLERQIAKVEARSDSRPTGD